MAIELDASSVTGSPHDTSVDNASVSHTVGAGANGILFAFVGGQDATRDVDTCTYGGTSLTFLDRLEKLGGADAWIEIWYMLSPPAGSATLAVTLTGTTEFALIGVSWFGVDQTQPFVGTGEFYQPTVSSSAWDVDISTDENHVVCGATVQHDGVGTGPAIDLSTSQTLLEEKNSGDFSNAMCMLADYEEGASPDVNMAYSSNWSGDTVVTAHVSLIPEAGVTQLVKYAGSTFDPRRRIIDNLGRTVPQGLLQPGQWFRNEGPFLLRANKNKSLILQPNVGLIESVAEDETLQDISTDEETQLANLLRRLGGRAA